MGYVYTVEKKLGTGDFHDFLVRPSVICVLGRSQRRHAERSNDNLRKGGGKFSSAAGRGGFAQEDGLVGLKKKVCLESLFVKTGEGGGRHLSTVIKST